MRAPRCAAAGRKGAPELAPLGAAHTVGPASVQWSFEDVPLSLWEPPDRNPWEADGMIRFVRYIWTNLSGGWAWFRNASPQERKEAWWRYWPPFGGPF